MSTPFSSPPRPAATVRARRPTVRELPADLLTPVGAFLRIRHHGPAFLLESVERGQQVGRYSFLGAGCKPLPLDSAPDGDLFAPLRVALSEHAGADREGLPPFTGGAVGYVAYDAIRALRADRRAARPPGGRPCGARALPDRRHRRRVRPRAAHRRGDRPARARPRRGCHRRRADGAAARRRRAGAGALGPARRGARRDARGVRGLRPSRPGAHRRAATRSRSSSRSATSARPPRRRSPSTARCAR